MAKFVQYFTAIDINIYSILFIVAIAVSLHKNFDHKNRTVKYLSSATFLIALQLFCEIIVEAMNKYNVVERDKIIFVINTYLYVSGPIIMAFLILIIHAYVNNALSTEKIEKYLKIPILISALLAVINLFTPILFRISELGIPQFGPLYYYDMLAALIYTIVAITLILKNRKSLNTSEIYIFLSFEIAPVVGAILQMIFPGTFLVWSFVAITVAMIYVFLQKKITQQDTLTRIWTRTTFDIYLENKLDANAKEYAKRFSIIFMDLDEFKQINDKFGHPEGDKALKKFADIMKKTLNENTKIARYGGDEFVALYYNLDKVDVRNEIASLEEALVKENASKTNRWNLKFSYAYDTYSEKIFGSTGQFVRYLDNKMYEQKKAKKAKEKV
ncbi:MAG: GGDEF domain-containing protein [Clostridia bacterium]